MVDPPDAARPSGGSGEHILVVDDSDAIRAVTAGILTGAGYQVTQASSRDEAASLGGSEGPGLDMVLTDVVMPGISAPDLVDVIRSAHPGLPIAFMSGYAADPARGGRPLPDDIPLIAKPFDAPALLRAVRDTIDRR